MTAAGRCAGHIRLLDCGRRWPRHWPDQASATRLSPVLANTLPAGLLAENAQSRSRSRAVRCRATRGTFCHSHPTQKPCYRFSAWTFSQRSHWVGQPGFLGDAWTMVKRTAARCTRISSAGSCGSRSANWSARRCVARRTRCCGCKRNGARL